MSSRASATVLLIPEARTSFLELQLLPPQRPLQLHASVGELVVARILARHFPVKMLLTLIEPAAGKMDILLKKQKKIK